MSMRVRNLLIVGTVLSSIWATGAYFLDQRVHEKAVAEVSAQCADLDDKHEEDDCRRRWREAVEKRLPVPSGILSLALAFGPLPVAWLAGYFGMIVNLRKRAAMNDAKLGPCLVEMKRKNFLGFEEDASDDVADDDPVSRH